MAQKKKSSASWVFIKAYFFHLVFLLFLVNFIGTKALQLTFYAQSCLTSNQVANDSRCLYIYGNNVYEKGTQDNPHHGNPCGTDITSIIPGSHMGNAARYLDPNFVGGVCVNVVPTATPVPQPTATPQPTQAPQPTALPQPTQTPKPTSTPQPGVTQTVTAATVTPKPTAILPTATKKAITTITATPNLIISVMPTITNIPTSNGTGFGKYVPNQQLATAETVNKGSDILSMVPLTPKTQTFINNWVSWSGILVLVSFFVLFATFVWGILRKLLIHKKS